ncbi:MAG: helix-turn-helix domain-containing protein [Spirochaetes bacterium]|nr:helix-turn-helix domain-containing protein [Spirochaetota bacterium]
MHEFPGADILDLKRGEITCVLSPDVDKIELFAREACGIAASRHRIRFDGRIMPADEWRRTVAPSWIKETLFDRFTGAEHFFLHPGRGLHTFGILRRTRVLKRAQALLDRFASRIDLSAAAASYDLNEKSILAVVAALLADRPVVIFYRIARHLTLPQFESLTDIMNERKLTGTAFLYIPERIEELTLVADKVYTLNDDALTPVSDFRSIPAAELARVLTPSDGLNILSLHDPIYRAKKVMKEHLTAETVSFENIAASVGLSYDFFRKEFKKKAHTSPKQYYLKLKMDKAKELLLYSSERVEDIAEKLGFTDGSYFAKQFRRHEGTTPNEFRRGKAGAFRQ